MAVSGPMMLSHVGLPGPGSVVFRPGPGEQLPELRPAPSPTGSTPAQVVTCLTRDSYLTHCFLQHLMAVLSSLERTPSPEPVDKDFYSEFGNKTTGTPLSSGCR